MGQTEGLEEPMQATSQEAMTAAPRKTEAQSWPHLPTKRQSDPITV